MIARLFRPLRSAATWYALVHAVLDLAIGMLVFVPTVVLLAVATAFVVSVWLAPVGIALVVLLLGVTRVVGDVERNRLAALHGVDVTDPVLAPVSGSWWGRLRQRIFSVTRWKGVAYSLLRLPTGVVFAGVTVLLWSGSAALVILPAVVHRFPDDRAHAWLFDITAGLPSFAAAVVGLVGLTVLAPWATVLIGRADVALVRGLLGPDPGAELAVAASQAETSRAAAVGSAETERRRIERDLHDGAQQRLVALAMDLGAAREVLERDPERGRQLVAEAHEEAKAALKEIRDLVRGIHPVILEDRGLDAALSAVVARSPVPVELRVDLDRRLPPAVESTAYFVVSEALANVARHAGASVARVAIVRSADRLVVEIRDDGGGGADPAAGTGLAGLRERVVGMGGTMDLLSPTGGPTTLLVELPCGS